MSAENAADQKQRRRWRRREEPAEEVEVDEEEARGITTSKGRITPGRRASGDEEKSGNFIVRFFRGAGEYIEGVRSELAKVTWPSREDTRRLSIIVLIATIISSIVLGLISLGFTELFRLGLGDPIIFVVFFAIVAVVGFFFYRRRGSSEGSPY
jgi:preprotein translocase subunit SecE